jgi:transcriptional regulator with XRE-family HTH domain
LHRELRLLRDAAPVSLRELAVRLHVSDSSLSRYFTGQALPPWEVVAGLCRLTSSQTQQWSLDAKHRFVNSADGRCLEITAGRLESGAALQMARCANVWNQQ